MTPNRITRLFLAIARADRAVTSAVWFRLERIALWIMARSALRITGSYRIRTAKRAIRHSNALAKAPIVRLSVAGSRN